MKAQKEADAKQAAILAEKKRLEAEAKKQAVLEAQKRAANSPAATAAVNAPAKELGLKQLDAPALPISQAKQDKLAALLQLYKADKLSPEDYQTQRSAILAEP